MQGARQLKGAVGAALVAAMLTPAASTAHIAAAANGQAVRSAAVTQCVTAPSAAARSVTLAAEMHALRGASRMSIRIDLQERLPGLRFKTVSGPGTGAWRSALPGIAVFQSTRTLSGLTAPAAYRGVVYFRWARASGRIVHRETGYTPICRQPAPRAHKSALAPANVVAPPLEFTR